MNRLLLLILSALFLVPACSAADAKPSSHSTNEILITCEQGFEYLGQTAIYRGNVHAVDSQMSLTCDTLIVTFSTNQTNNSKIEKIVAESNVVITQQQGRATGDLAVYTATNDIVELHGHPVMQTPQGRVLGETKIVFDRRANRLFIPGRVKMELPSDAFGKPGMSLLGTNAIRLPGVPPPTNPPPAAVRPPAALPPSRR
jgi:lipopolysaccharide export system protein LptA